MPVLLSLALLAAPALAQSEEAPRVEYADRTEIGEDEFRELEVEGELVRPTGGVHFEVERKPFPSWIELRTDFSDQMVLSTDQLR